MKLFAAALLAFVTLFPVAVKAATIVDMSRPGASASVVSMSRQTVVVRMGDNNSCYLDDGDKIAIEQAFLKAGITPVWDGEQINRESQERRDYRSNDEVDQGTVPHKGTLQVARYVAELSVKMTESRDEWAAYVGRYANQYSVDWSGQTTATMISLRLIDRSSGATLNIYRVVGVAKATDHLGVDILKGFFGSRLGVQTQSESDQERQRRSFSKAVENLRKQLMLLR